MSLHVKIFISFFLITILPLTVLLFVYYHETNTCLQQIALEALKNETKHLANNFSETLLQKTLIIAGLSLLFIIFVGYNLCTHILIKPLKTLLEATKRISNRDYDYRIEISSHDEIGSLAQAFNMLAQSLQQGEQEHRSLFEKLQTYQHQAEDLVRERTRELEESEEKYRNLVEQTNDAILTERQQAQKAFAEEQNLLRTLIEHLPDHIYVKDTRGRFILANNATLRARGITKVGELLGKTDLDLYPKHLAEQYYADEQTIIESGEPLINREEPSINHETNSSIWLLTTRIPLRDIYGNIIGIVGINRDITERKQAEEDLKKHRDHLEDLVRDRTTELTTANEQLRREIAERKRAEESLVEERNLLRTLIDNFPDLIYVKDTESRFIIANNALVRSMGITSLKKIIGKTDFDFNPKKLAEQSYADEQQLIKSGQPLINQEEPLLDWKTGDTLWFLSTKIPLRDSQGKITGLVGIARNITERKRAEEELKKHRDLLEELVKERTSELTAANAQLRKEIAERKRTEEELQQAKEAAEVANRAKSDFLSSMSHELRTPLNGILGYAQILQQDKNLRDEQKEALKVIYGSGNHLLTLINDILDLSKIEAQKMELTLTEFHLPKFLQGIGGIIGMRSHQKNISYIYEAPSSLPSIVVTDEKRLRQVLINLLGNAVKFTDKGQVTLRVRELKEPDEFEGVDSSETQQLKHLKIAKIHKLRFEVADTGPGMTPEHLEKIFAPFEQVGDARRRAAGTGLGLAISQRLVRMMGSELHVTSAVGRGTTFWFDLEVPEISRPLQMRKHQLRTIVGFKGETRKILIVDDNSENRAVFKDILQPLGFDIAEAVDGQNALNKVVEYIPDLIIMDLVMPGMNGFEAIQRLRQIPEFQHVIVIAVSADVFEQTREKSLAVGSNAFLTKPVHINEFLELLEAYLELEWIYEEEVKEYHDIRVSKQEQPIIPPSQKELAVLYEKIIIGDITGFQEYSKQIQASDSKLIPFVEKINHLAEQFALEEIEEFIASYMETS